MKTLFNSLFVAVLIATVTFSSCSKDEDKDDPVISDVTNHYVEINGVKTKMQNFYDVYFKPGGTIYNHNYILLEETVTFNDFLGSLSGIGKGFSILFRNSDTTLVQPGSYVLDSSQPDQIYVASYRYDYDFFMKEGDRINMKSGGCTFTSTGHPNEFVVEGIFIGVDDKEYKIYYKGIIARKYGN